MKTATRIFIIFMTILMLIPMLNYVVLASTAKEKSEVLKELTGNAGKKVVANSSTMGYEEKIDVVYNYIEEKIKKEQLDKKMKPLEETSEKLKTARSVTKSLIKYIKGEIETEDINSAELIDTLVSITTDVLDALSSLPPPAGPILGLVSTAIDMIFGIFKACMGGQEPTPELVQLEDRLNMRFEEVKNQLSAIEDKLDVLSDQVTQEANRIISEITSAIDNLESRQILRNFLLSSGKDDFSYNEYKNYIYGTENKSTAYYILYKDAVAKKNDEVAELYFDLLYKSVMDQRNAFYNGITGDGISKSIVQSYYDILSSRPDLVPEGKMAETMAIDFACDLYRTEMDTMQIIMTYNTQAYIKLCISGETSLRYGNDSDDILTLEMIDSMDEECFKRLDQMRIQFAKDLLYVLKLNEFYTVKDTDNTVYSICNNDSTTFGNIVVGQTVYLKGLDSRAYESFNFSNSFYFASNDVVFLNEAKDTFTVVEGLMQVSVDWYYNGEIIGNIIFTVCSPNDNSKSFVGGSGTANDPYLICNTAQFQAISDDLSKHYRLIRDLDFKNVPFSPLGQKINSNNATVYEPLTGSLDGNGHTIRNISISGTDYVGIFGQIGQGGIVTNLKIHGIALNVNIASLNKTDNYFHLGAIAGENSGMVKYCQIDAYDLEGVTKKSLISFNLENTVSNRHIHINIGGIAGTNKDSIVACAVDNVELNVKSQHNFAGDSVYDNTHNAYVGGITGTNLGKVSYCATGSRANIYVSLESILDPTTDAFPYSTLLAGGIIGNEDSDYLYENISEVQSDIVDDNITTEIILTSKSGWGAHKKHCKEESDPYIPEKSDHSISSIKASESIDDLISLSKPKYVVSHKYNNQGQDYESGDTKFKKDGLQIFLNGTEKEYKIVGIYGFDTYNESITEKKLIEITLILKIVEGDEILYLEHKINATVNCARIDTVHFDEIIVVDNEDFEIKDIINGKSLVIERSDDDKKEHIVAHKINSDYIKSVEKIDDTDSYIFGERKFRITYQLEKDFDVSFEVTAFISCPHGNTSGNNWSTQEEPTCTKAGKTTYYCGDCGSIIRTDYIKQIPHELETVGYVPPLCYVPEGSDRDSANGFTGTQICKICAFEIIGVDIPKKQHIYVKISDTKHECTEGGIAHTEDHQYTVKESVEWLEKDAKWCIKYTYTCIGCGFEKFDTDTNTSLEENSKLPTVMVSDGYVLEVGDEVIVYVQLLNNPGINGACFGIRYTEGLELISVYDGELFNGSLLSYRTEVANGYNFVWVGGTSNGEEITSIDTINASGNLLKLKFKVTPDIENGKERKVSVVYGMGKTPSGKVKNGGFVTADNSNQCFVTEDGIIRIVEDGKRLPGDVNGDGKVNILDAVEIAEFLAGEKELDERYANVDLSYDKTNPNESNIQANDIVVLLKSTIGGYGTNLKPYIFDITLITYDEKTPDSTIQASMYDENGEITTKYNQIIGNLERTGYKFLGWSYFINGEIIDIGDFVTYNPSQGKQTLYAQWEVNSLSFNAGSLDNVVGTMDTIYYSSSSSSRTPEPFQKKYNILFSWKEGNVENKNGEIIVNVASWICRDSSGNLIAEITSLDEAMSKLNNGNLGALTLTAVWEEIGHIDNSDIPDWAKTGHSVHTWYGKKGSIEKDIILSNGVVNIIDINIIDSSDGTYYLYPRWERNIYTVTFDANGGMLESNGADHSSQIIDIVFGEKYASILPKVPERAGYTFIGWKNADGIIVDNLTMETARDHTLKASWKGIPCVLILNSNGGTLNNQTHQVTPGEPCLTLPKPSREGYDFDGWFYDSECKDEPLKESEIVEIIYDTNVYAKWNARSYKVKYNLNPSSILSTPTMNQVTSTIKYDSSDSLNAIPTAENYAFIGWSTPSGILLTDQSGSPRVDAGCSGYMIGGKWKPSSEEITLYATWIRTTPNAQIISDKFVASIKAEGELLAQDLEFTVSGIHVKYKGQYYIYGNAYYNGKPSSDGKYMYDPYSITISGSDKDFLIGGLMYWKSNHDNYQQCNVAGWDWNQSTAREIVYSSEDPGRDFMTNQNITIYLTECCIATGRAVTCENDGVPEMVEINNAFSGNLMMSNNSRDSNDLIDMGKLSFNAIGLKVKYENAYYIYGCAKFAGDMNKERRNNVCDVILNTTSPVLLGGTMFWRGSVDDGNEASTAGFNRNGGFNSTRIRYMTMHADNDYAGDEHNIVGLFGVCFKYADCTDTNDTTTPEIGSSSFNTTIYCESEEIGTVTFNVTGIRVTKSGEEFLYGNAFYTGTPGTKYFSNVATLKLTRIKNKVLSGGMIHWYGSRGAWEENGTAGYNPILSDEHNIQYMQEDPGNDFTGNEPTEMTITGICVSTNS